MMPDNRSVNHITFDDSGGTIHWRFGNQLLLSALNMPTGMSDARPRCVVQIRLEKTDYDHSPRGNCDECVTDDYEQPVPWSVH